MAGNGGNNEDKEYLDPNFELKSDRGNTEASNACLDNGTPSTKSKPKRSSLACIRCRNRHIRCPGGQPCKKCLLAKTKCEYVEADKKIVVSMKYLSKLHEDIARLKKENAVLRNNIKEHENKTRHKHLLSGINLNSDLFSHNTRFASPLGSKQNNSNPLSFQHNSKEIIQPSLDKYGRLIHSRTGEKIYVGSSSMTLFGLEIQDMVPPLYAKTFLASSSESSPMSSPASTALDIPKRSKETSHLEGKNENRVFEKEGNAYKITLAKTNTRPGLAANFTLPSYSYAMLLVDTFINYNDGCFYFFNEGLVKKFLMNLYAGQMEANKKIIRRNSPRYSKPKLDERSQKQEDEEDTILETIWFCKIFLIFATGEMYLGTESDTHIKGQKEARNVSKKAMKSDMPKRPKRNTLPGAEYFFEASELFTGLFASGAIDNITKDGGIEAVLLYAFYLQVADCTIASYFYFGLALRASLILGWHVDADKNNMNRFELEHRRRIWWTVYMYERMLSSKAGLPLSFADDSVSTELPAELCVQPDEQPMDEDDIRAYYIFPPSEYIKNCVTITQINANILSSLYTRQPTMNILPVVTDLVNQLITWKSMLPDFLNVDFSEENIKVSRLVVNLMTEYFQGVNLAVRPLLFHFATKKLKELQSHSNTNKYVDLSKYSKNVIILLNSSFQASICTIKCIWALLPDNMVALFGWMDREYLFASASTLILFNASFGVHETTKVHLDHALVLFTKMKKLGNYPAALRRAQLLKLISVLDFNGIMSDLLAKHDDEGLYKDKVSRKWRDGDKDIILGEMDLASSMRSDAFQTLTGETTLDEDKLNFFSKENYKDADLLNMSAGVNTHSKGLGDLFIFDDKSSNSRADLDGIEGVTYIDEEQKLWNEITNDAIWLNFSGANQMADIQESSLRDTDVEREKREIEKPLNNGEVLNQSLCGVYGDIINQEFRIE